MTRCSHMSGIRKYSTVGISDFSKQALSLFCGSSRRLFAALCVTRNIISFISYCSRIKCTLFLLFLFSAAMRYTPCRRLVHVVHSSAHSSHVAPTNRPHTHFQPAISPMQSPHMHAVPCASGGSTRDCTSMNQLTYGALQVGGKMCLCAVACRKKHSASCFTLCMASCIA